MSLISKLIHHLPEDWEHVPVDDYDEKKFVLCKVDQDSEEYKTVTIPFKSMTATMNLQRVQYPAAYLRYAMKSELHESSKITKYLLIEETYLNIALKFNCDSRRTGVGEPRNADSIVAEVGITTSEFERKVIIVFQERKLLFQTCKYDDDIYPTHVITFVNPNNFDDNMARLSVV